ncbi:glycosyltransferase [Tropicimonas sp. IMCC6043]|nr:glycosyltransferase [Tropicimonas sp. IMCC6043]
MNEGTPGGRSKRALKLCDRDTFNENVGSVLDEVLVEARAAAVQYSDVRDDRMIARGQTEIDIVICIHNALEDVKACLASVDMHLGERQRVFLVDDGSDAPTEAFLKEFSAARPHYFLHRNEVAMGYTKAANLGVNLTDAEVVILLNSDTIVPRGWAEKLADALIETPGAGIAGPMSNAASYQSLPSVQGTAQQTAVNTLPEGWDVDKMDRFCEKHASLPLPLVPLVHSFCFAMTREVWDQVGPFDETAFPKGFGEENDFCFRATDAGFGLVLATHTFVFHAKTKSYDANTRHELVEVAQAILYERHGLQRFTNAVRVLDRQPQLRKLRREARALFQHPS